MLLPDEVFAVLRLKNLEFLIVPDFQQIIEENRLKDVDLNVQPRQ